MAKPIIHTKYRLELGHPYRVYGIARLVLGLVLMLIALKAFQGLGLPAKASGMAQDLAAMFGQGAPRISYGFHVILTFGFACYALAIGVLHALAGAEHAARLYLPAKVPDDFLSPEMVSQSLREREILTYRSVPSAALRVLRAFFAEGVAFLAPSFRPMVVANTDYIPRALAPVLVVAILISARGTLERLVGSPIGPVPFPTAWLIVVLAIGAFRLGAAMLLIPRQVPAAEFERASQTVGGAGHPENFLADLENKSDEFRYLDIPNRILHREEITLVNDGTADSGKIRGGMLLETQPIPEGQSHLLPGFLFLAGGCICLPLGLYLLCFLPFDPRTFRPGEFVLQRLPVMLLDIVLGVVVLQNGRRFLREAEAVLGRMLFSSDVFDIAFSGTYYRGEIGAGMAHDDSLRSTSMTIRSEVIIRYFAARCLSESVGFGKRDLLETTAPDDLRQRVRTLMSTLEQHQERGAKLVGIDMESGKAIEQIVGANVQLQAAKQMAVDQAKRQSSPPPRPVLKEEPKLLTSEAKTGESDLKECPECAEMVRAKARKCRFCGYQFEES